MDIPTLVTTTIIIVIIGLVQHFKVIIEISNLSKSKQDHSTLSKGMLKWLCPEWILAFICQLCILQLVVQIWILDRPLVTFRVAFFSIVIALSEDRGMMITLCSCSTRWSLWRWSDHQLAGCAGVRLRYCRWSWVQRSLWILLRNYQEIRLWTHCHGRVRRE